MKNTAYKILSLGIISALFTSFLQSMDSDNPLNNLPDGNYSIVEVAYNPKKPLEHVYYKGPLLTSERGMPNICPAGKPCGPVIFADSPTPKKPEVKDNTFSISNGASSEYRKQTIHFKKMGEIDVAVLKNAIKFNGKECIRQALDKNEMQEPYVVKMEKEDPVGYVIKIPAILIIHSTFYKKNRDNLTCNIYENYTSLDNNDRNYKIDNCTTIEVINNNKKSGYLVCVTKLYDRLAIEQLLNRPETPRLNSTSKQKKHTKNPSETVSPMSPID